MRTWILPTIAGVLALALIATSSVAVVQHQRAGAASDRAATLDAELDALRDEVDDLRSELDAARAAATAPEPEPEPALPGDEDAGSGGLDGLLDSLLGTDGIPGQACLMPDTTADPGGLLDGLFGGAPLPDDPTELVEVVSQQVADLRELEWETPVEADFLGTAELQDRLEALLDEDLDPAEIDASERLLVALGAIPAGASLEQLQRDLLDDQVAGYYVPDTGELVVRVPDDGQLRSVDKVTLAHELDHALTDQALGIPDRGEPPFSDDADASLGLLAVVEGDATLIMNLWTLQHLSLTDQLGMAMDPSMAAAQQAFDDVPHFLQQELLYPYMDGLDWACDAFLDGGWAAIDAAYDDPPSTSAEVLWGRPVTPMQTAALTAPDGYDSLSSTTIGAAHLLWLLEAPGGDTSRAVDDPEGRARAWGGGTVEVWGRGDDTAIGVALADRGEGAAPLCETVTDWYGAAFDTTPAGDGDLLTFDGDHPAAVSCDGADVVLGIAPDLDTATAITGG